MTELALELIGVSKSYGRPGGKEPVFEALRATDISVLRGAFTTIVGPSGAGKSTLLAQLGLLDVPTAGTIRVLGHELKPTDDRLRRYLRARYLGFVFQAFHLMSHRTVLDNTMLGGLYRGDSRRQRRVDALERLDQVGLGSKVNKPASTLSGGERQRTAIARALVGEPQILLCDEPTGNLDTKNSEAVVDLLGTLTAEGITVVIVTHDSAVAALGSQQLRVVDGQVSDA
ncbi:ABC transporter ATP-binding protein [Nocardioides sp. NPDC126508]